MEFTPAPLSSVMQVADPVARLSRLFFGIPFAFRKGRGGYLMHCLRLLSELPVAYVEVTVFTNTAEPAELAVLDRIFDILRADGRVFRSQSCLDLEHPYALPWENRASITDRFLGSDLTHWIHMEDDARFTYQNLCYFIYAREILRPHGLIPSFVRYEWNDEHNQFYGCDHCHQADVDWLPHIDAGDVFFTTLNSVYNATIVLDQELAAEFVQTRSFDMHRSEEVFGWWIAERAAMGLAWENVPPGHSSRLVIPVRKDRLIPATPCLIHHLPDNYTKGWFARTNPPDVKLGRLPLDKLFMQNGDPGLDPERG